MDNLNGSVLNGQNFLSFIKERKYLLNRDEIKHLEQKIYQKESIVVFLENFVNITEDGKYKLLLKGILETGEKTDIIVEGIVPYIIVRKLDEYSDEKFSKYIEDLLTDYNVSIENLYCKGIEKYEPEKTLHLKILCDSLFNRKKIIGTITKFNENIKFSCNDISHYERVALRENDIKLGSYNLITKFISFKKEPKHSKLDKVFRVNAGDIKYIEQENLGNPKTIIVAWDIETETMTEYVPDANRPGDAVFMIALSVKWNNGADILKICFTTYECTSREEMCIVVCKNEKELILSMFKTLQKLQCDYIVDFNGGEYDWPFIIDKCVHYKILQEVHNLIETSIGFNDKKLTDASLLSFKCRKKIIKLDASISATSRTLQVSSITNIDMRTVCRQLFPLSEKSKLSYFLDYFKLSGKTDMSIPELRRIYLTRKEIHQTLLLHKENKIQNIKEIKEKYEINKKDMGEVAYYCFNDALVLHSLFKITSVLNDRREIASLSFTTIDDAYYTANRMKLINIVMKIFYENGYIPTQKIKDTRESVSIEGATVFYPKMGLIKPKVTLSEVRDKYFPEMEKKYVEELISFIKSNGIISNNELTGDIKMLYDKFLSIPIEYPVCEEDFTSLYPSLMLSLNLSPEQMVYNVHDMNKAIEEGYNINSLSHEIQGIYTEIYSLDHNTLDGKEIIDCKKKGTFGIYQTLLLQLFNSRIKLKDQIKKLGHNKENQIQLEYLDSKQKAVKIFMNTLYGVLACLIPNSTVYNYQIASTITNRGRYMVNMAKDYFVSVGCTFIYGDTDSTYIQFPSNHYKELDLKYFTETISVVEYSTELVKITKNISKKYMEDVNQHIKTKCGNLFLKMATGGIFFPMFFPGIKKTAFGINHEHSTNFDATLENLYEKGVQMKKRGASGLLIKEGRNIELDIINIHNKDNIMDIIKKYIHTLFTTKYPLELFTKSVCYRSDKNNIAVKEFKDRMVKRNDAKYPPPKNGERFNVIVADYYPFSYDIKGNKTILTAGEKYEYLSYMQDNKLEPDLKYYISTGILTLCSMVLLPDFYKDNYDKETDIETGLKNSKKYVESLCDGYKKDIVCLGPVYKKIYSDVKKTVLDNSLFCGYTEGNVINFLITKIKKDVIRECNKKALRYLETCQVDIKFQLLYKNKILPCILSLFEKKIKSMNIDEKRLNNIFINLNNHIQNEINRLRILNDNKVKLFDLEENDEEYIKNLSENLNKVVKKYMFYQCVFDLIIKINTNQKLFEI